MNTLTVVLMITVGLVLVYAGVKGQDPREIIKTALHQGS